MSSNRLSLKLFVGIATFISVASFTVLKMGAVTAPIDDSKLGKLKLTAGFKAEHLYSPSESKQGSWVAMTFDDKGRMITSDQYGSLYRFKVPAIGSTEALSVEKLKIGTAAKIDTVGMGYAHGLLYAFNSRYVMINNGKNNKTFPRKSGL